MRHLTQDPEDKVLWTLVSTGGKVDRTYLRRRLDMKLAEMEPALAALESKKKIKREDFKEKGKTIQIISLLGPGRDPVKCPGSRANPGLTTR